MLWGLLVGCGPGFAEPEIPEYTVSLRSGLGVDPFTGMLWAGRVEKDPQLQAQVDAEVEAIFAEAEEQGELTLEQLLRLEELDDQVYRASTARVTRVDPDTLQVSEVGVFQGEAGPVAVFAPAGTYLGARPVDAEGYATGSVVYGHPETSAFLRGGRLAPSPLGGWFVQDHNGVHALVPDSLGWSLPLDFGDYAFLNSGVLLGLSAGELVLWEPGQDGPKTRFALPTGVRPTELVDVASDDQHALIARPKEGVEGTQVWLADLSTGAVTAMPSTFFQGRFSDEGGVVYGSSQGVVTVYNAQGALLHEIPISEDGRGEAWLSPDGQAMVYETSEGVGWRSLATGASTFVDERDLNSFQYAQGRIWVTASGGVESLDLDTGLWEMWPLAGCTLSYLVVLPDAQTLAGRCGQDEVALFDTVSGGMRGRVGL